MPTSFASATTRKGRTAPTRPRLHAETVADFITASLAAPPTPPPPKPKPPRAPGRSAGIWDELSPAERSEYAKKLAAKRKPENMARHHRLPRAPSGWTADSAAVATAAARLEAVELVSKLKAQGLIAKDDPEGEAATIDALTVVRAPGGSQRRLRAARQLLAHYHRDLSVKL